MKHRPRKRFGQNFLIDDTVVQRILAALNANRDDHIVEVGPGLGALTFPLLRQLDHLQVIEIDRDLIERLKHRRAEHLEILEGDVLQTEWERLYKGKPLRVVGNLPYNIGTPLLLNLIHCYERIQDIHVMLQQEVVDRLCATPGTRAFGRLSILVQSVYTVVPLFSVPANAFDPPPKVVSAVVRLQTRTDALAPEHLPGLQHVTRQAFANKRKTLRNNFRQHLQAAELQALGVDPQVRAESLDLETFLRLASALEQKGLATD